MDMSLLHGTITGLKTASDIAKGFLELKSIADVQGKVIELQSAILSAQSSALAANSAQAEMVTKISTLKEEIASIKEWEAQKQRYKLVNPWSGAVVYSLKESMANGEPAHWICTSCYEGGRKSILNPIQNKEGWFLLVCPICKSQIQSPWRNAAHPEYATESP